MGGDIRSLRGTALVFGFELLTGRISFTSGSKSVGPPCDPWTKSRSSQSNHERQVQKEKECLRRRARPLNPIRDIRCSKSNQKKSKRRIHNVLGVRTKCVRVLH